MTKAQTERPDLLEIAAMRARWKEERAAGATGETFARWRVRVRAEVLDELRKVLDGDRRRWPDPRKRDLGKPERRKRRRQVSPSPPATLVEAGFVRLIGVSRGQSEGAPGSVHSPAAGSYHTAKWLNAQVRPGRAKAGRLRREPRKVGDGESRLR